MRKIAWLVSMLLCGAICCCTPPSIGGFDVDGDVSIAYLRSLADDRSQVIKGDLWIDGRIVLNDKLNECHKSLIVEDSSGGIDIKVDVDDIDLSLPLYYRVRIRCSGLSIGREGERIVLGTTPNDVYVVNRIPEAELANYIKLQSLDGLTPCEPLVVSVSDVHDGLMQRYVRINNLKIIAEDSNKTWCERGDDISDYGSTLRRFTDGCDTLVVATLNKCHYATELVPNDTVSLIGVVDSFEQQHVLRISNHQIQY